MNLFRFPAFYPVEMLVALEPEILPVAAARAGDAAAWGVLLARYRLPLYAYVCELVHQEQTALDIVQEAFINAAKHIGSLRDDSKFGSWLFNIAHQKCIQHWRKTRPGEISIDPQDGEFAGFEPNPREQLIRKEREEEFLRIIGQLAVPHRAVLLLYFIEDFSLEEIARITETGLGTVKSRLHYARKAFKQLFEETES